MPINAEGIAEKYREGMSLRELAAEYEIPHTKVRSLILSTGTPMRLPGFRNAVRDSRIIKLHERGYSLSEIGSALGISRQRVHQVLNRKVNK